MDPVLAVNALPLRPGGAGVSTYIREVLRELVPVVDGPISATVAADACPELPAGVSARPRTPTAGLRRVVQALADRSEAPVYHGLDVDLPWRTRARTVTTVHDLGVFDVPWAFPRHRVAGERAIVSHAILRADAVIADSDFTAERIEAVFGRSATVVPLAAPPGFAVAAEAEVERVRRLYDLPRQFVFHVGTLEPRKNLFGLAEACRRLAVPLVCAGADGWVDGPPEGIVTLGFVPPTDLSPLYGAAAAAAYVSCYEGFGLPPLEAMASGCPVVSTAVPSVRLLGAGALVVDPYDIDGIEKALSVLVHDPSSAAALAEEGRVAVGRLSWRATAEATARLYGRLGVPLRGAPAAAPDGPVPIPSGGGSPSGGRSPSARHPGGGRATVGVRRSRSGGHRPLVPDPRRTTAAQPPSIRPTGSDAAPPAPPGRLRIAVISYYLPSGSKIGVGYWVDQYARELVRRGHEVVVFSSCPPVEGAPYRTETVSLGGGLRTFRFATTLRHVDFSGFDVLHANGDDYWLWRRRVPAHVRTMHGSCFSEARRIEGARERLRMVGLGLGETLATLVADRTFVVSPATRRWMPWVRDVQAAGVDVTRFRRPPGTARETVPTILFVGTFHSRKRGWLLAEAFEKVVRPAHPEAQLWMVAEDCPARPGVVPLGRLSDDELVERYHRAWVFCLPSSYEGLGIPYIEAMASGLPVVATANPGARFVLEDGASGRIVEPDRLGEVLLELLGDEGERRRLAGLGERRAEALSLQRTADAYERAYRQLLEAHRPGEGEPGRAG